MTSDLSLARAGRLIVIEGADGTGKTTQLARLHDRLRRARCDVSAYDFPSKSGTPVGEMIGAYLRGEFGEVTPEFLALAFSADRMAMRDRLIDDLEAGRTVLCDRYVASNVAFQSAKIENRERRDRLERMLVWFEYEVLRLPMPDLQIVLVASDEHFFEGRHLYRTFDATRSYVERADIHELQTELQIKVNAYYSSLIPSSNVRPIAIERQGMRLDAEHLSEEIWGLCEATRAEADLVSIPGR